MSYGRVLYNNIKEYTPKWFKTIPYSKTEKPSFIKPAEIVSNFNSRSSTKKLWRLMGRTVQRYPWAWQTMIFFIAYAWFHVVYDPILFIYRLNNKHRTLEYALNKERAFKKQKKEQEDKENAQ